MATRDSWSRPSDGDQLNQGYFRTISEIPMKISLKNVIRQLQDRSVDFSNDMTDGWGEAYTDSNGRNNSLSSHVKQPVIGSGIAFGVYPETPYDEDSRDSGTINAAKWTSAYTDTGGDALYTHNVTNNKFRLYVRGEDSDTASITQTSNAEPALDTSREYFIGGDYTCTGNHPNIDSARITVSFGTVAILNVNVTSDTTSSGSFLMHIRYSGGSWEYANIATSGTPSYNTFSPTDGEYKFYAFGDGGNNPSEIAQATLNINFVGYGYGVAELHHTIPSGTFNTAISSGFLTALVENWEAGANIQYKLLNTGGDDSGWLDYNKVSEFTAFTNGEPDELQVKLIPKTTSPTTGYPSIKGCAVIAV